VCPSQTVGRKSHRSFGTTPPVPNTRAGTRPGGGDGGRPTEGGPPNSDRPHGDEGHGGHPSDGEPPNLDGPGNQPPPALHRDEPLPGEDLLDQYKGENDPDNPNRYFRPKTVDYLSPEDLEKHRLFVSDGLLYSVRDGVPTLINRKSGHYQPDQEQLSLVRDMLQNRGSTSGGSFSVPGFEEDVNGTLNGVVAWIHQSVDLRV